MSRFLTIFLNVLSFLWTVVGALILWAAQVTPDQAIANWLVWLNLHPPAWMRTEIFYYAVMTLGVLIVLSGVVIPIRLWRRRVDLGRPIAPIVPHDEFISLQEACTRTYETFRKHGGKFRKAPDELSTDGALGWCASFLIAAKHIPVYGTHPPSRESESVPDFDLGYLHVENNATELHEAMSSHNPIWTNLQVLEADLLPILDYIKREYRD